MIHLPLVKITKTLFVVWLGRRCWLDLDDADVGLMTQMLLGIRFNLQL